MTPLIGTLLIIGVLVLGAVVYVSYRVSADVDSFYFGKYLTLTEVAGLTVTPKETEEGMQLTISGLNSNSAQCVTGYREVVRGDTVVLLIKSGLATGTCSGNVSYVMKLSPESNHVAIKNAKDVIWSRSK